MHRLLQPDATVLDCLGRRMAFELAVGFNGLIWIRAETAAQQVVVANALKNSEHLEDSQIPAMCAALLRA